MYGRQSHDWTGSQRQISLLSARSYIFTFQRRRATGGGTAAARWRPILYGCRACTGCRSANVAWRAQLLQGAVFTWIRVFPICMRWRRLLSRTHKDQDYLERMCAAANLNLACTRLASLSLFSFWTFIFISHSFLILIQVSINLYFLCEKKLKIISWKNVS